MRASTDIHIITFVWFFTMFCNLLTKSFIQRVDEFVLENNRNYFHLLKPSNLLFRL